MATMIDRVEVIPLSDAAGAEIRGVDLRRDLSPEVAQQIRQAWWDHVCLVIRDQELTEEQQVAFARNFGQLGSRGSPVESRGVENASDYIMLISNIRKDGQPIGSLPDGEMMFHADMCYHAKPHNGTMLYAIEVPSRGGETLVSNQYRAYERLSAETRKALAGRTVTQMYSYGQTRVDFRREAPMRQHSHPAVIRHPETGRPALYVNRLMTAWIDDMPADESDAILEECFAVSEAPDNVYAHAWRVGDLFIWDNHCANHARNDFPDNERRLMRRCTVFGKQPLPV